MQIKAGPQNIRILIEKYFVRGGEEGTLRDRKTVGIDLNASSSGGLAEREKKTRRIPLQQTLNPGDPCLFEGQRTHILRDKKKKVVEYLVIVMYPEEELHQRRQCKSREKGPRLVDHSGIIGKEYQTVAPTTKEAR